MNTKKKGFQQKWNTFFPEFRCRKKKGLHRKWNTFFPRIQVQIQVIGGDADEDHTQIVGGYTVKLLGGIYPPIPYPGFGTPEPGFDSHSSHTKNLQCIFYSVSYKPKKMKTKFVKLYQTVHFWSDEAIKFNSFVKPQNFFQIQNLLLDNFPATLHSMFLPTLCV